VSGYTFRRVRSADQQQVALRSIVSVEATRRLPVVRRHVDGHSLAAEDQRRPLFASSVPVFFDLIPSPCFVCSDATVLPTTTCSNFSINQSTWINEVKYALRKEMNIKRKINLNKEKKKIRYYLLSIT